MRTKVAIAATAAFGLGGLVAALAVLAGSTAGETGVPASVARPAWAEVQWPFPLDEWGKGKAFTCGAADCGTEVNLYIRAKIGFCNCTSGVADDDELDRISDYDLLGNQLSALGPGREIN